MDQHNGRAAKAESLVESGRWSEAVEAYAEVVAAGESDFQIHFNFGTALMHCSRFEKGRDQFSSALRYRPDSIAALTNLAGAQVNLGNTCAAADTFRRIVTRQPDFHTAWVNLGVALADQGLISEGIEALQRGFDLAPDDSAARNNLLLHLNYACTDGLGLAEVHQMLCAPIASAARKPLQDTAGRRICIGYVSNDFRGHSVAFFLLGILGTHDRGAFEVFCYSLTHAPDRMTENFVRLAEHFVDLSTCSDAEAAGRIEADQIDILVDLGGHTSGSRIGIFAFRPAPIQATYLGYPATTGCPFIDFRMVDAHTDPEGSEAFATEELIRLPAPFLCYTPNAASPDIAPLPALANGFITFGSFNQSAKISDETLDLWSGVLAAVPDSRMFIKARAFSDTQVCDRFRGRFAERGIDASRISFSGLLANPREHLAAYGKVDIALDTFPYNGTTTTCEALWMGVPVISLVGGLHAARVGYTILTAVGLAGLATTSADEFVSLAAAFSEDRGQLAELRGHLRMVVANSPLCDRARFTKGLEDAYRKMVDS
ncbi:MAG: tetratricopeptide repeat protein [Geothrix sp.]|uniref:O-linked N-acetylglucosamine transferase, SPINDLY family protein n=1 Tax=Geothrix sp. TaxID=1962974 RepID=UPI0018133B77|nr:tetratricopeptide repeat protein [Geothrix sp.]NWJ41141.1 tetratricopeptide repeat protein [Geothrix sp.]WIL20870.1 MAG: tetratricopeptide repeat protein [Geothrix sp.]